MLGWITVSSLKWGWGLLGLQLVAPQTQNLCKGGTGHHLTQVPESSHWVRDDPG